MNIERKNDVNFGWFYGTHKRVTRLVVKDFPKLALYRTALEEAAQKPDFYEAKKFSQSHFFSISKKRSFLDFRKKSNALTNYQHHVSEMLLAIENKDKDTCIEQAGRALHYLQDIAQPQHSQRISILSKLVGLNTHLEFEGFAKRRQEGCFTKYDNHYNKTHIHRYKANSVIPESFDDIFLKTAASSSKNEYPTRKNRYAWERIGRKGINDAIVATRLFIEKLNNSL